MIELANLTPAEHEAWSLLFDLAEEDSESWVLIGGQMVFLLAREHGTDRAWVSDDADVLVNVRLKPGGTQWLSTWLTNREFEFMGQNRTGVGLRFEKLAISGPGKVSIDVLAPDGLGRGTPTKTIGSAWTVQAPGGSQALSRSSLVEVAIVEQGQVVQSGKVRRPSLLAAIVIKAAAIRIAVRDNRDRDWEDAAFMLSFLPDPEESALECTKSDRGRLNHIAELLDAENERWGLLGLNERRAGAESLKALLGL